MINLFKKIIYIILGLMILLCLFIVICYFNPQLTDSVSDVLYSRNKTNQEEVTLHTPDVMTPDLSSDTRTEKTPETDYTLPDKTDIKAPEEVSGRNGYVPVRENTEQISEEEVQNLQNQVTYGETGDGLTFDTEYYPYYGMLDSDLQKLYRQIYANANVVNADFLPVVQVTPAQLKNVFLAVFNDHPEIFWLDPAYSGKISGSGKCVEILLEFNKTADNLDDSKAAFDWAANEILTGARNIGSDYEKEVYVHKALLDRVEYNLRAPLNQTAYSALVNGQTVCAGYARAFQYLMQQLDVPCYYCTGFSGENHAWNVIKLDGDFYNVDTTWNDTNPNTLDYFNKTDAEFSTDHLREDLSIYLPACNGIKYAVPESNMQTEYSDPDQYKRSLEDIGLSEQDVLTSMEDYYADCYNQIIQSGGSVQFQNVIADESMWLACYNAYTNNTFADYYGNQVLTELSAEYCEVYVEPEELKDGMFLLNHRVSISY